MDLFATCTQFLFALRALLETALQADWMAVALKFFPYVLLFELPVQLTIMLGAARRWLMQRGEDRTTGFCPSVSCIVTCYAEGRDVRQTIKSLTEQLYDGQVEILAIVDGAVQNRATYAELRALEAYVNGRPRRRLEVVAKLQRGGRVSSLNQGLALARGQIVIAIDGDTSFDNDMLRHGVKHFARAEVVAVSGNLRVRNAKRSLWTRLQAVEYMLSIHLSRAGLDAFNIVNNVSGAFGIFRRDFLRHIGGWDSGTAEDLDLTLRIKKYFARYPKLRIRFEPRAIGHTDAPHSFGAFLKQRLRWDGDLSYLYLRKYRHALRPGLMGLRNFVALVWTGLLFQLVFPFIVIGYSSYVFFVYPAGFVLAVLAFVYLFYLLLTSLMYLEYLLLYSERRAYDLQFAWVVLLLPGFAFVTRCWSGIATLMELFTRAHLDSAMAPSWVLRRTKF
ncbi:MAG TPA: glycosyltransferase [Steroidobacteraceae bacterium]|nr:glycosyltransferase [Steroidobacteraceae bacterium]